MGWNTNHSVKKTMSETDPAHILLVISTISDIGRGRQLARQIIDKRLAACCNIVPGITSFYRWQDELCEDRECLLVMKTLTSRYRPLEDFIIANHPYDLPELIAVPVNTGLEEYLAWISRQSS